MVIGSVNVYSMLDIAVEFYKEILLSYTPKKNAWAFSLIYTFSKDGYCMSLFNPFC